MVQATTYEVFPFTSPARALRPVPLAERAQSGADALNARSRHRAILRTRQHWILAATGYLMDWLADLARSQLAETRQVITWEQCSGLESATTKGRTTT